MAPMNSSWGFELYPFPPNSGVDVALPILASITISNLAIDIGAMTTVLPPESGWAEILIQAAIAPSAVVAPGSARYFSLPPDDNFGPLVFLSPPPVPPLAHPKGMIYNRQPGSGGFLSLIVKQAITKGQTTTSAKHVDVTDIVVSAPAHLLVHMDMKCSPAYDRLDVEMQCVFSYSLGVPGGAS